MPLTIFHLYERVITDSGGDVDKSGFPLRRRNRFNKLIVLVSEHTYRYLLSWRQFV